MTDNEYYRLQHRADHAAAVADTSTDPGDHLVKNAMAAVVAAERERIGREARERAHGIPDPDSFPRHSEVTRLGTFESYGPPTHIDVSALTPDDDTPPV